MLTDAVKCVISAVPDHAPDHVHGFLNTHDGITPSILARPKGGIAGGIPGKRISYRSSYFTLELGQRLKMNHEDIPELVVEAGG